MGKHRVYVNQQLDTGNTLTVTGEDAWHITGVLRLGAGDAVTLCDGAEHECEAEIISISKHDVMVRTGTVVNTQTEPLVRITLYQALPKADKMELIIQKCTEIGAAGIVPVLTSRSIPARPGDEKVARWQKIAREAARQSGRGIIPAVGNPVELRNLQEHVQKHDIFLIAYEAENKKSLRHALKSFPLAKNIGIFIGPEGGISDEEIQMLQTYGAQCVTLGRRVLRTETAGLAMLSAILYAYGEMG